MKLFSCDVCGQVLFFENTVCMRCGHALGFDPAARDLVTLAAVDGAWIKVGRPNPSFRFCANREFDVCNWLIEADAPDIYCRACRHNRVIPNLADPANRENWRRIENAKHRLFYTLVALGLPLDPPDKPPLAFEFLADFMADAPATGHVMTGHEAGVITIALAEADDAERERRRTDMGEPYRTLLGHFRHEIAHWYWDVLVSDTANIEPFRALFGDERVDYGEALQRHYREGPPPDWQTHFVSTYASSHPWEDFAETWAHYFHIVDTTETAQAFGLRIAPRTPEHADLAVDLGKTPRYRESVEPLLGAWMPLSFALNSLNRSMGFPDPYPFVISTEVGDKLDFVHRLIGRAG